MENTIDIQHLMRFLVSKKREYKITEISFDLLNEWLEEHYQAKIIVVQNDVSGELPSDKISDEVQIAIARKMKGVL